MDAPVLGIEVFVHLDASILRDELQRRMERLRAQPASDRTEVGRIELPFDFDEFGGGTRRDVHLDLTKRGAGEHLRMHALLDDCAIPSPHTVVELPRLAPIGQ